MTDVVQALSGFASVNANAQGEPRFVPQIIVDKLSGLFIVEGVLAALLHRERTGEARSFELPMFETASYFLMTEHLQGQTHQPPIGPPGYAPAVETRSASPIGRRTGSSRACPISTSTGPR